MCEAGRLISVVMPTYNVAGFVREAARSILAQTHRDLELIAVDDGSSDQTPHFLDEMAAHDERVRVIRKPTNSGVADSLNVGFAAARGRYLARMDADDLSLPSRLETQLRYLDSRPAIGAVGCWVGLFRSGETEPYTRWCLAEDHGTIRSQLFFNCSMQHSSCLFRRRLLDEGFLKYDMAYERAEDYEFWVRLSANTELANVPSVLYHQRVHPGSVSQVHRSEQKSVDRRIRLGQLRALGLEPSESQMEIHQALSTRRISPSREFLNAAETWLLTLRAANDGRYYPEPQFSAVLAERWYMACRYSTVLGTSVWRRFHRSDLADVCAKSRSSDMRFLASSVAGGLKGGRRRA